MYVYERIFVLHSMGMYHSASTLNRPEFDLSMALTQWMGFFVLLTH